MLLSLELTDFKSFRHARVDLAGFTLLIGSNASGKSNLREALRVLHGIGRGFSLSEVLGGVWRQGGEKEWDGIRGGAGGAPRSGTDRFTLRAGLEVKVPVSNSPDRDERTPVRAEYTVTVELNAKRQPVIAGESLTMGRYGFDTHPDGAARPEANERIITARVRRGTGGKPPDESFVRDRAVLSQIRESDHATAAMRRTLGALTEQLASLRFLDLQPEPARVASPSGADVLGDNGQNLSSVLESIVETPADEELLTSWIRELTPMDATAVEFLRDLDGRVMAVLVESDGTRIPLTQASDGTVRFLAILALLLSPEAPSLIVLEEIENGIHPHRVRLLLELIESVVSDRGLQVIATTHSPALLAHAWDARNAKAVLVARTDGRPSRLFDLSADSSLREAAAADSPSALMEAGWFEDMAAFLEEDEGETTERAAS